MNKLLFICLVTIPLVAVDGDFLSPGNFSLPSPSQKAFETCKKRLHPGLREFVDDFAGWPQEERDMVIVFDYHITIDGLSAQRRACYQDDLWQWMMRDTGRSAWKYRLAVCLEYLKK